MRIEIIGVAWFALTLTACTGPGQRDRILHGLRISGASADVRNALAASDRREGLLTTYVGRSGGAVWLELPPPDENGSCGRYIYVEGLLTGLGSNPIGLDRGQIGPTRVIEFRRVGDRVVVEHLNYKARAMTDNEPERRAAVQSFARSVLWAGSVSGRWPDGRIVVNFTDFIVRDAHGVADRLKRTGQGTFKLDPKRSMLEAKSLLVFPDNLEFEALLTFSSDEPGGQVREVAPTPQSISVVQHHSLVRLPDDEYRPRRFDPRAPSFAVTFLDYAAPLDRPVTTRWIARHRLEKANPNADMSPPVRPIVYYVDRGAPEPVRQALIDGAAWWNHAFESAGFIDAFQVRLMPEDAHPLDCRYNVIQWVHRATRGWSYGGTVTDPRTGEIIKGHVTLGSLRVRQDRMIFEGLLGTQKTGSGDPDDPIQLALARIRQLSAHEVGHTLGFTHNFAASTYAGRASVMDYPAPLIEITNDGQLDCTDAYAVGIGLWDRFAVRYAYTDFPPGVDETTALAEMVADAVARDMLFLSDADARPGGAAHPLANLWDNGDDPVAALEHTLKVRTIALQNFSDANIAAGRPLAGLHEVFATIYLHHRYQVEAAVKTIGGVDYAYGLRGEATLRKPRLVDAARQRKALDVLLKCLDPSFLRIEAQTLSLLAPRPFGYRRNREMFRAQTGLTFDALGAAGTAADMVLAGLLHPERCARLIEQHARDRNQFSIHEMLEKLVKSTFGRMPGDFHEAAINRVVQSVLVSRLIALAENPSASSQVRRAVMHDLGKLDFTNSSILDAQIKRFLDRPYVPAKREPAPPAPPPGSPIGSAGPDFGSCAHPPEERPPQ